ncbi:FAD binding domain-containing protein [Halovivax sp.]|uniref:FAD binding domain-containing protein n=1 Tax=Halovivax sp. TaxID=1935978 RepID=UPI0025BB9352|nr:FAD binding domain-containing protein [Halovivax sp.]
MYPPAFDYRRASSVDDALSQLSSDDGRDVRPIAGGHGLLPAMKTGELAPDVLVDIGNCEELRGIERIDEGVVVGALTTHAELVDSAVLRERVPVLAQTAAAVGDVQIRTRGTIGGNLVEADPGADVPAALLATGARIRIQGADGHRELRAADVVGGPGETAVAHDELVTEIVVPDAACGAYVKRTHPSRGFAMVGVAAVVEVADGAIATARLGAVGATERPIRLRSVEEDLEGVAVDVIDDESGEGGELIVDEAAIEAAAGLAAGDVDGRHQGDVHASGAFRAQLLGPTVAQAVSAALERASRGEPA